MFRLQAERRSFAFDRVQLWRVRRIDTAAVAANLTGGCMAARTGDEVVCPPPGLRFESVQECRAQK